MGQELSIDKNELKTKSSSCSNVGKYSLIIVVQSHFVSLLRKRTMKNMMEPIRIDRIEDAIEDIRQGKMVIVVDDADRENEGDFVIAARFATPEVINFMATHGRGLICVPLTEERCKELDLDLMVGKANTAHLETAFTVSVDYLKDGCTTGISASDRARTVQALIDPNAKPGRFWQAGTYFSPHCKSRGSSAKIRTHRGRGRFGYFGWS